MRVCFVPPEKISLLRAPDVVFEPLGATTLGRFSFLGRRNDVDDSGPAGTHVPENDSGPDRLNAHTTQYAEVTTNHPRAVWTTVTIKSNWHFQFYFNAQ